MLIQIGLGLLVVIVAFSAYVATREGKFVYVRSDVIQASKERIFPFISDLRLGGQWSPYEQMDPKMKKTYLGEDGQVGSKMVFESKAGGSGSIELLKIVPNESVELRLLMTSPIPADHIVEYKLTPEGQGTRFTWTMSGDGGFFGKLMNVFIDCEKMVGGQFSQGIANLKSLMEKQN